MSSEPELLGGRRIRELLQRHGVMLTKSLGQNFVVDPNTIRKVVEVAGVGPDDHVLEVGAGAGSLTLALAASAGTVTAVEIDERLRPVLYETLRDARNVTVTFADILDLDLAAIGATKVVANLPYNIAAQTVIRILEEAPSVHTLCVMTQREVGERLVSKGGSKSYGITSILVRYYARAQIVGRISRTVFFPVPNVDSVLVTIERWVSRPTNEESGPLFPDIVRAAFGQRRKTIRNALSTLRPTEAIERALREADIDPDARAETLFVTDFIRLSRVLR